MPSHPTIYPPTEHPEPYDRAQTTAIRIYVAEDALDWTGTVIPGRDEAAADHAERTEILKALFAG